MIIDDLDIVGTMVRPDEANPPLIVDTNAVLPQSVAAQSLQSVARRDREVQKVVGLMNLSQFALRGALDVGPKAAGEPPLEQGFSVAVSEGADHVGHISAIRYERQAYIFHATRDSVPSLR